MSDKTADDVQEKEKSKVAHKFVEIIGDAFAFVRSAEANAALATVTLEALIHDQIIRNGESDTSKSNEFTPYSHDPDKQKPAGTEAPRANFASGVDVSVDDSDKSVRPTKLDFIRAVQNEMTAVIKEIKASPPSDAEYTESVEKGFAEEDITKNV